MLSVNPFHYLQNKWICEAVFFGKTQQLFRTQKCILPFAKLTTQRSTDALQSLPSTGHFPQTTAAPAPSTRVLRHWEHACFRKHVFLSTLEEIWAIHVTLLWLVNVNKRPSTLIGSTQKVSSEGITSKETFWITLNDFQSQADEWPARAHKDVLIHL